MTEKEFSKLPQHVQDAFTSGGSVCVHGHGIVTDADAYVAATAEQAELTPASPKATSGKGEDKTKELVEANKALEKSEANHAKTAKELEESTKENEVFGIAIESAKTLIKHFVPKEAKDFGKLGQPVIDDIVKVYGIETEGLDAPKIAEAILAAVHPKE